MRNTILAFVLIFCLASTACGKLWISVDRKIVPSGSELWVDRGEVMILDLSGDGVTEPPLECTLYVEGPGSIDGHRLVYTGSASVYSDLEDVAGAMGLSVSEALHAFKVSTGMALSDLSTWVLDDASPAMSLEGRLIDNIVYRCLGKGDVLLTMEIDAPFGPHEDYTILIHQTASRRTYHVDTAAGDDGNTGLSPEAALATIQKAIDSAYDGDTLVVQPGRYMERINFRGKNITVRSTNPADPCVVASTVIDCNDWNYPAVTFHGAEDPNCALVGFKVQGAVIGYDVMFWEPPIASLTRATISHCDFQNAVVENGKVIIAFDGLISNCLIAETRGAICACIPSPITTRNGIIRNCTIANPMPGTAIAILEGGTTTVQNCIFYNGKIELSKGSTLNIDYSVFDGIIIAGDPCGLNIGPGNFQSDPCFVRLAYWDSNGTPEDRSDDFFVPGDYHLKSRAGRWEPQSKSWVYDDVTSPCIDAGNPGSSLGDEPGDLRNVRVNMGAYGGTSEAGKTPLGWSLLADLTNDGIVNERDFAYQTKDRRQAGGDKAGDLDRNGIIAIDDIAALVGAWLRTTRWH